MNSRKILALFVSGALAMPVAGTAQARHQHGTDQQAGDRGMGGMMGQGMQGMQGMHQMMMRRHAGSMGGSGGMMAAMAAGPGPGLILGQRETLELTDAQVKKLEALRDRLAATQKKHAEAIRSLEQDLAGQRQPREARVDLPAYESLLRRLANEQVALQMATVRGGQEARDLLTPEQAKKLRAGMQFMHGMMGMMSGPEGPMGGGAGMAGQVPCSMGGGAS
ncbi:MAG: Spy/CpxP family protein refolding chaperone [Gemmatimonadota bacterium]